MSKVDKQNANITRLRVDKKYGGKCLVRISVLFCQSKDVDFYTKNYKRKSQFTDIGNSELLGTLSCLRNQNF